MLRSFLAAGFLFCVGLAPAVGTNFPLLGKLEDPAKGKALNGTYNLQFVVYNTETGGAPVGSPVNIQSRSIKDGIYYATLDFGASVFDGNAMWIEISYQNAKKPGAFIPTAPRILVSSVPYAQVAGKAQESEVADTATTASYAVESLLASHAATADSAANAGHAAVADSLSVPINAIAGNASAYVTVKTTADPAVNGQNLHAAYAEAKALTPNGQPLSATNRATLLVVPGRYLLDAPLTLDTEFVDLVGLTSNRSAQHLVGRSDALATATLAQTANNVRIENLLIELPRSEGTILYDSNDPSAYFPDSGLGSTAVRNCEFKGVDFKSWSMRLGVEYAGRFDRCTAGKYSFGYGGTASGIFTHCTAGDGSFGPWGTASGIFTNCTAGAGSLGSYGTASGVFTDCTAGGYSFGNTGTASGTFTRCIAGDDSFGRGGNASGTFTNCIAGDWSFGVLGTASGIFTNCTAGIYSFGYGSSANGGKFYHCIGGLSSFFFGSSDGFPKVIGCICNGVAVPEI